MCGSMRKHVLSRPTDSGAMHMCVQVYRRQSSAAVDSRYYAPQRSIPFGVDANKLSDSFLGDFLK